MLHCMECLIEFCCGYKNTNDVECLSYLNKVSTKEQRDDQDIVLDDSQVKDVSDN